MNAEEPQRRRPIVFTWGTASSYGWGTFGLHLALSWARDAELTPISAQRVQRAAITIDALRSRLLDEFLTNSHCFAELLAPHGGGNVVVSCPVLHALGNGLMKGKVVHDVDLVGACDIGIVFIEDTMISHKARARAWQFSLMVAGSTWNKSLLEAAGLQTPVKLVMQGVDRTVFHPGPKSGLFDDRFVIFSGGKLEYRKGQDLVLLAFRAFRERHPEALLVCAWHSPWSGLAQQLAVNPRIVPVPVRDGRIDATGWAAANGIPTDGLIDVGPVPNFQMAPILRECDVALFPNRAEGGTNLVAMECMACGVPCIVSANTGHLDLIQGESCLPLMRQGPVNATPFYRGTDGWGESDIEEIVESLETMWAHCSRAAAIGQTGAVKMAGWGWPKQAADLKQSLLPYLQYGAAGEDGSGRVRIDLE